MKAVCSRNVVEYILIPVMMEIVQHHVSDVLYHATV